MSWTDGFAAYIGYKFAEFLVTLGTIAIIFIVYLGIMLWLNRKK